MLFRGYQSTHRVRSNLFPCQRWNIACRGFHQNVTNESNYHDIADQTLEELHELLSVVEVESTLPEVEVSLSQGVLKADFGPKGKRHFYY